MEQVYIDTAKMLKAMSDPKRLRIVDMLSCGEMCACVILESFHINNFSHDMKLLVEAGIVNDRREGKTSTIPWIRKTWRRCRKQPRRDVRE